MAFSFSSIDLKVIIFCHAIQLYLHALFKAPDKSLPQAPSIGPGGAFLETPSCTSMFDVIIIVIMKQYVIDQLRLQDYDTLKQYMDERFGGSGVNGLYWIPMDTEIYGDVQKAHAECHPFFFAVELTEGRMSCELLVRTTRRMRCDCIAYASTTQRNWIIDVMDAILEKLCISI